MVRQNKRKTRTVHAKGRKPSGEKRFSRAEPRPAYGRPGRLIQLYLELGLPWPKALQAAVADLQQLSAYYRSELFSAA